MGEPNAARRTARPLPVMIFAGALALGGLPAAAQAPAWNPQPQPDDVEVPLPCGQGMVFKRIVTLRSDGGEGLSNLDDRRIILGWPSEDQGFVDYTRAEFISGPFADGDSRFFLMAKYETTRAQYESLRAASCDAMPEDPLEPVTMVSWYEAVEFSRLLSLHMHKSARDVLAPLVNSNAFYARLPTEAEWEFAARGGNAVTLTEFQAERFPMPEGSVAYIWFNDPESAQDGLDEIGILDPNPLGLFDIYGNAAEMTIEPFRMNKAGRLHGQAGAFIAKGGSFVMPLNFIRSASRAEYPYIAPDTGEETRNDDLGFRLVIAGPALSDLTDYNRLRSEWDRAAESVLPSDNPLEMLTAMEDAEADIQKRNDIGRVKQVVRFELTERNEREARLLQSMLGQSAKLIDLIRALHEDIEERSRSLEPHIARGLKRSLVRRLENENAQAWTDALEFNIFNADLITGMLNDFDPEVIEAAADAVASDFRNRGRGDLADAVNIAWAICTKLAGEQDRDRETIMRLTLQASVAR